MPDPNKPVDILREIPQQQRPDAPPVVLNPSLPAMEKTGDVKTVLRNTLLPLMGAGAPIHPGGPSGLMEAAPSGPQQPTHPLPSKPQEPKPSSAPPTLTGGYVRLQVRSENGNLSIVGAKQVPGPLAMPSGVIHGYVYEVLLDEQQIALGSVPDAGVMRSFANRDVPGPQGKHHFATVPSFEFAVRIPAGHLVTANLPKLNIVLHKVEQAPDRFTSLAPLARQPGVKLQEVARLPGIRLDQLPVAVRPELERIVTENERLR
jgi:hypothetical protein